VATGYGKAWGKGSLVYGADFYDENNGNCRECMKERVQRSARLKPNQEVVTSRVFMEIRAVSLSAGDTDMEARDLGRPHPALWLYEKIIQEKWRASGCYFMGKAPFN
jgi:hypothetical protein